jgi:hypothetical protein
MRMRTMLVAAAGMLISIGGRSSAQSNTASATSGFDGRAAKHRGGVFFTREEIRKRSPARLSDLFRGLSGIALSSNNAGKVMLTSTRGGRTAMSGTSSTSGVAGMSSSQPGDALPTPAITGVGCSVTVGMDGQLMDPSFSIDDVPVSSVHGIEVYTGSARIPVEFGAANNSACGVVMVWSKTGADTPQ